MDSANYNIASLQAHYATTSGGTPDTLELKWGTASGSLPNVKTVPWVQDWATPLKTLLPGPGVYYTKAKVTNKYGALESAEYPFECGVAPDGSLVLSLI